jgi:hypothetical protein
MGIIDFAARGRIRLAVTSLVDNATTVQFTLLERHSKVNNFFIDHNGDFARYFLLHA